MVIYLSLSPRIFRNIKVRCRFHGNPPTSEPVPVIMKSAVFFNAARKLSNYMILQSHVSGT
jgi:hypothetical protein